MELAWLLHLAALLLLPLLLLLQNQLRPAGAGMAAADRTAVLHQRLLPLEQPAAAPAAAAAEAAGAAAQPARACRQKHGSVRGLSSQGRYGIAATVALACA